VELMDECPLSEDPEQDLLEAFRVFDKDGNGYVTAEEFKATMTEMGDKMSMQDVENFIKEADADGDGNLNYQGKEWLRGLVMSVVGGLSDSMTKA
jgi:calmodulin